MKHAQIVLLCNIPWNWTTDYVNQTALLLSENNTVVCFFGSETKSIFEVITKGARPLWFTKFQKNLYFFDGVSVFPFSRFSIISAINRNINAWFIKLFLYLHKNASSSPSRIVWFFDPRFYPYVSYFGSSYRSVYDCVDYWKGDPFFSRAQSKHISELEILSVQRSSVVVVNSEVLYKKLHIFRKNIVLAPQGFRLDQFCKYRCNTPLERQTPVIGYVGAINERLDYKLLFSLASSLSNYVFIFVGPLFPINSKAKQTQEDFREQLFRLPNVIYKGQASKEKIPAIIDQFTIGIVPYMNSYFNRFSYPAKTLEYFYMGKPVISTRIDELTRYPKFVKIGKNVYKWKAHIRAILSTSWPHSYKTAQRRIAIANSWKKKVNKILTVIESDQSMRR